MGVCSQVGEVKMKAYSVSDCKGYCDYTVIAFAESRGKAITAALGTDEFPYQDWSFTELRAVRMPDMDKYYRGHCCMDWDDPIDRLAMVKDGGYYCDDDCFDPDECAKCVGKEYCSRYEEYLDEEDNSDVQNKKTVDTIVLSA